MMPFKNKRMRPLLLIAVAFLIIVMVSAHVFGAVFLSNAIVGAFSLHRPILYVLIGLVIAAVVLFKFKHVLGHLHKRKESR
jgi:phosphotransferase system  glucose/maltose/N-acetylglucosamine-specific IIC component